MYHDTIRIQITNFEKNNPMPFEYSFLISKTEKEHFAPVMYGELIKSFENIGLDTRYVKFYDVDLDKIVYCTYNYQPNFNIFFRVYDRLLKNKDFNITFECGNFYNGKFGINNMNSFAGVIFKIKKEKNNGFIEEVIKGKEFEKLSEVYQILDQDGKVIHQEFCDARTNFKNNFFENYKVQVATRKYKLNKLNKLFF